MSNYKLIKPDDTELAISVVNVIPGAMSFNSRLFQGVGSSKAVKTGTGVRQATVFTITVRISAETKAGAMTELASIYDFAKDALYLAPSDESTYRALQGGGDSVAARRLEPLNTFGMEWFAQLVMNPRYPQGSLTKVSSTADYEVAPHRTLLTTADVAAGGTGTYGNGAYGANTYGG